MNEHMNKWMRHEHPLGPFIFADTTLRIQVPQPSDGLQVFTYSIWYTSITCTTTS